MGQYSTRWSLLIVAIFTTSSVCGLTQRLSSPVSPTPVVQRVAQIPPLQSPRPVAIPTPTSQPVPTSETNTDLSGTPATDVAANQIRPLTNLTALSSSPTLLRQPTSFTATVNGSSPITYTWNFGDGSNLATGSVVTHTYGRAAIYTTTLTATNSVNSITTTLVVTVTDLFASQSLTPTITITGTSTTALAQVTLTPTPEPTIPTSTSIPNDDDDEETQDKGNEIPVELSLEQDNYFFQEGKLDQEGKLERLEIPLVVEVYPRPNRRPLDLNTRISVSYLNSDEAGVIGTESFTLGELNIPANISTKEPRTYIVRVDIADNDISNEIDKKIFFSLVSPENATLKSEEDGGIRFAQITVEDDDASIIRFAQNTYRSSETVDAAPINVLLDKPSAVTVTVGYSATTDTAQVEDFTPVTGMLTFPPLSLSQVFTVPITDDGFLVEPIETVLLSLTDPISASFAPKQNSPSTIATNLELIGCSLPDAIEAANRDEPVGDCPSGSGPDTITLTNEVYLLTEVRDTSDGANGLPTVTSPITINGNGAVIRRSDQAPDFRIFRIMSGGDLTLNDIEISNGRAPRGGAILNNDGVLAITRSIISGNQATGDNGGGVFNGSATTTIRNSTIQRNKAITHGGGIDNNGGNLLVIEDSIIEANEAINGHGGGIGTAGITTVSDSTISLNRAAASGGGITNIGSRAVLTVTNTTISTNTVTGNIAGGGFGGGIGTGSNANNDGPSPGSSATVIDSLITFNTAITGGGVHQFDFTTPVTLTGTTTVSNNIPDDCVRVVGSC